MRKGHTAYLAHVVDTHAIRKEPRIVPLVCEYLDVFLEKISVLPTKREIEFTIEVVTGTTPISQNPYRVEPSKLKELKSQIEELLEKSLI